MALVDFIRTHDREIIDQFELFARTLAPGAASMTPAELRDHAQDVLTAIVIDLGDPQTADEQFRKSMGQGTALAMAASGRLHADHRIAQRFDLNQVVAEFRALRASVFRLYAAHGGEADLHGVERFNEAMDEALAASVVRFSEQVDLYKNQFVGVLSHDLRAPLGAITAGAALLTQTGEVEAQRVRVASRILSSAQRMTRMIGDLLDLTRTRLGAGIPIARRPMDLHVICEDVALELKTFHPDAELACSTEGDLRGDWDPDRLTQVVSNLVGNALQHGDGRCVSIVTREQSDEVVLTVHNSGRAIPQEVQTSIFEPLARYAPTEGSTTSIGLGLFIARAIVVAHGGTIAVSSTESRGTTFEVRLPRHEPSAAAVTS
jgi:signal transduction histidine kinase